MTLIWRLHPFSKENIHVLSGLAESFRSDEHIPVSAEVIPDGENVVFLFSLVVPLASGEPGNDVDGEESPNTVEQDFFERVNNVFETHKVVDLVRAVAIPSSLMELARAGFPSAEVGTELAPMESVQEGLFSKTRTEDVLPLLIEVSELLNSGGDALYLCGRNCGFMPAYIPSILPNLKELYLSHNVIDVLPPSVFKLSTLTHLSLDHNRLREVPPSCDLPELQMLFLNDNKLTTIASEFFDSMHALKLLNLSSNALTEIPTTLGSACAKLSVLSIDDNFITTLPNSLVQLKSLNSLSCENNKLVTLPEGLLSMGSLGVLMLRENDIPFYRALSADLPSSNGSFLHLSTLDMSSCALESIPDLSNQLNLTVLKLAHNTIGTIPLEVKHLTNLRILDLSFNDIQVLPPAVLEGLTSLVELNADNNALSYLPSEIVKCCALRSLSLCHNKLSNLPLQLNKLPIASLKVRGNLLVEFSCKLPLMTVCDYAENQLDALGEGCLYLAACHSLCLSGNSLNALPAGVLTWTSLVALNLSHNNLSSLPVELNSLSQLQELQAQGNQLSHLPSLFGLYKLEVVNFSFNAFVEIPATLSHWQSLRDLNISHNLLNEVGASLQHLPLRKLNLSYNQIRWIPDWIHESPILDVTVTMNPLEPIR